MLVPERFAERCAIEAAYSVAVIGEARDRYGTLLYVSFSGRDAGGMVRHGDASGHDLDAGPASACDAALDRWRGRA